MNLVLAVARFCFLNHFCESSGSFGLWKYNICISLSIQNAFTWVGKPWTYVIMFCLLTRCFFTRKRCWRRHQKKLETPVWNALQCRWPSPKVRVFWVGLKQASQVSAGFCLAGGMDPFLDPLCFSLNFTNLYRLPFFCTSVRVRDDFFQIWVFCPRGIIRCFSVSMATPWYVSVIATCRDFPTKNWNWVELMSGSQTELGTPLKSQTEIIGFSRETSGFHDLSAPDRHRWHLFSIAWFGECWWWLKRIRDQCDWPDSKSCKTPKHA